MNNNTQIAIVALGSNLASGGKTPDDTVPDAARRLAEMAGSGYRISPLYSTPAFPEGSGPMFVNAVMTLEWVGPAEALLALLHDVENGFGRTRTKRWEARVMDLDLIALGQVIAPDRATRARWAALSPDVAAQTMPEELILPHPRLAERAFVLVPLADVAPDWVDPATGRSVARMLDALPPEDVAQIKPLAPASPPSGA